MPGNLEIFQEWENTSSRTTVHILQIDRSDGSAANRLTLTDNFYLDKGVSGSKYYDTYPAPIQCIISDLETNESMDQTSFSDIVLANGNGKFNDLRTEANIIGHRFTVLRGDQSWSLLETDLPYKFIEIIRGQIESISVGRDKVTLSVVPVKYSLDNLIGSKDSPIHYGPCRNVPATLVDSATDKYRFSTLQTRDAADGASGDRDFFVRDNGVLLALTTDYTKVLESSLFMSQIALVGGAPAGKLTADLHSNDVQIWTQDDPLIDNVRRLILDELVDSYPTLQVTEVFGGTEYIETFCFADSDSKLYTSANGTLRQFALSSAGDITTQSNVGSSTRLSGASGDSGISFIAGGSGFYLGDSTFVQQYALSTNWTITTRSLSNEFDTTTALGGGGVLAGYYIPPTDDALYLLDEDGIIYRLGKSANDVSSAATPIVVLTLPVLNSSSNYLFMKVSADGTKVYFLSREANLVIQYTLIDPYKIESAIPADRSFFRPEFEITAQNDMRDFGFTSDATKLFIKPGGGGTNEIHVWDAISNFDLPISLITTNITSDQAYFPAGVFYGGETQIGRVLRDLLSSIVSEFTIDRLGNIAVLRLENPNATLDNWVIVYDIYLRDFIGRRGEHISHDRTISAKKTITVRFDKNYSVQSETELAGSVSEDDKAYFSTEFEITATTNTLADYIDPGDLILETFLGNNTANAESVRDYVAALWASDREFYTWETNLRWQTLLSDFAIGSIVRVNGDVKNPNFSNNDRVMVTGRRINWSKNKQSLTVFR